MMKHSVCLFTVVWVITNSTIFSQNKNSYRKEKMIDFSYSPEKKDFTFEESLLKWDELKKENGNSYIYQRVFSSWTGYGNTTQIKVENGVVTSRRYQKWKRIKKQKKIMSSYVEKGKEIGSHKEGAPPITIDSLYSVALPFLQVDTTFNDIYFLTYSNGLLNICGHYPKNCSDDCFFGVIIREFKWLKEE